MRELKWEDLDHDEYIYTEIPKLCDEDILELGVTLDEFDNFGYMLEEENLDFIMVEGKLYEITERE